MTTTFRSSRGGRRATVHGGRQDPRVGAASDIRNDRARRLPEHGLAEAISLAHALPELEVLGGDVVRLPRVHPGMLFGSGKLEELRPAFKAEDVALVLVDGPVSPVQHATSKRNGE